MPKIKREWCEITKDVINEGQEKLQEQLVNPLRQELPSISIQEVASEFFKKMRELTAFASELSISIGARSSEPPDLQSALVPLFKALFLRARLAKARELDDQRLRTTNPHVIDQLEKCLGVYDDLIREEWFQEAVPEYPLSLSDLLTLERTEDLDGGGGVLKRQFDEKFHILQSPNLFLPDLHYYRRKCGVRMIPVSIAFLDIDRFKEFNSEVGETHVDRHVLPMFMKSLEAHVYGHGFAYRFGGDEYSLLLPNADIVLATDFVGRFQTHVAGLSFVGTDRRISISVGLCVADRDCHLTDGELLQKAERAKNFAKKEGRNRVAGYRDRLFDASGLCVLIEPEPSSPQCSQ